MKFLSLSLFAIGALGQGIGVLSPANGTVLTEGTPVVVQVVRYNHILPSIEVGIAIGFAPCNHGPCANPLQQLGTVVYSGPFNPQLHPGGPEYENFTVTVPGTYKGPVQLGVARAFLIGAGPSATWGSASALVYVV